jgi:hypothetical protein
MRDRNVENSLVLQTTMMKHLLSLSKCNNIWSSLIFQFASMGSKSVFMTAVCVFFSSDSIILILTIMCYHHSNSVWFIRFVPILGIVSVSKHFLFAVHEVCQMFPIGCIFFKFNIRNLSNS